jgi:hypothetical protein
MSTTIQKLNINPFFYPDISDDETQGDPDDLPAGPEGHSKRDEADEQEEDDLEDEEEDEQEDEQEDGLTEDEQQSDWDQQDR